MKRVLVALLLTPPCVFAQTRDKSPIVFEIIDGKANGSEAILDARKAEIAKKNDGKLSGHDWWLWGLTAIDYDLDGVPDFMVTIHGPAGHGVFLRNNFKEAGKLTFTNMTKDLGVDWMLPSAEGRRTFVWDFDGDGWLDFAGCHTPSFLNEKGKRFTPTAKKEFGSFSPQAIVDLNDDGHPDVYNNAGQNGIWNPARRSFDVQPFIHPLEEKMPEEIAALWKAKGVDNNRFLRVKYDTDHDLDGDGENEVIVMGYGSYGGATFGRVLSKGKNGELVDRTATLGLPASGTPILITDLDGDGHLDILSAASAEAGFFRNNGKGTFTRQPGPLTELLKSRDSYLHRADAADFDRDGLLDLVVSKPRAGPKVIFANRGDGVFEVLHTMKGGWDSDPVCVCDLDDDGLLDVAIGGPGNNVTLFVNKTTKPGHGVRLSPRMDPPNRYAVGARIEAYRAGTLGQAGARPFLCEMAHADASPITIGLGQSDRLDLRVTFPGSPPLELRNVEAREQLTITPKGLTPAP